MLESVGFAVLITRGFTLTNKTGISFGWFAVYKHIYVGVLYVPTYPVVSDEV